MPDLISSSPMTAMIGEMSIMPILGVILLAILSTGFVVSIINPVILFLGGVRNQLKNTLMMINIIRISIK